MTLWTTMIFGALDNDLDATADATVRQMCGVALTDDVRVILQIDRVAAGRAPLREIRDGALRDISEDQASPEELNTGSAETLGAFIARATAAAPSDRRMLIMWNHGGGIDPDSPPTCDCDNLRDLFRKSRDFILGGSSRRHGPSNDFDAFAEYSLRDCHPVDYLNNLELRQALELGETMDGGRIDILGFDECLMNCVEIAYEVRDKAAVIVGSQSSIDGTWNHFEILKKLAAQPCISPQDLAKAIVEIFSRNAGADSPQAISVLDCSALDNVAQAVSVLAHLLRFRLGSLRQAIDDSRKVCLQFAAAGVVDLVDFCTELSKRAHDAECSSACDAVIRAVRRLILCKAGITFPMEQLGGISIYFPQQRISGLYDLMEFSVDTEWNQFLHEFFGTPAKVTDLRRFFDRSDLPRPALGSPEPDLEISEPSDTDTAFTFATVNRHTPARLRRELVASLIRDRR